MKKATFIIVALAAFIFAAQIATGQERSGHGFHHGKKMEWIKAELNLTDTQLAQMKTIKESYRAKMEELKSQEGERNDKRAAFHKLKEAQKEEINKILTPQQLAKAEAHKAERKARKEEMREKFKSVDKAAMKGEMKAYKKEKMHPVLLEQRQKLERSISAADKREIKELRESLKVLKQEMKKKRKQFRETGERPTDAQVQEMKANMDQNRPLFEKAQALTGKYATQIDALLAEIADEKGQWEEDMHGIKDKYYGELMEEMGDFKGKRHHGAKGDRATCNKGEGSKACKGKKDRKRPEGGKMGHHLKKKDHRTGFLLMDVKADKKADKQRINKGKKASTLKVYPNPSFTTNTLEYTIEKAGMVKIELHDKQGNVVKQISSEYKQPGTYKETANLSGLNGIVYFYVITEDSGVRSQKFMVRK